MLEELKRREDPLKVLILTVHSEVEHLIRAFSSITNERIVPSETLIVIDEIQEVPIALTALKYFCEDAPEYHILVAGSLLGVSLHNGTGFTVGKVGKLRCTR